MVSAWIGRLAEDERKRDEVRLGVTEAVARKAVLVALHGPRLLDELSAAVVRDIEMFRSEFPGDLTREILFEADQPDGGFLVQKSAHPIAVLHVIPHLAAAFVSCQYRFTVTNGLPAREDRVELVLTNGASDDTLHIKNRGTGQVFTNADALSEFLLVPLFTGRPR